MHFFQENARILKKMNMSATLDSSNIFLINFKITGSKEHLSLFFAEINNINRF